MSKLTFFVGKGGVGKSTVACAYALHCAEQDGGRVLLVSTDPAHSLADILKIRVGERRKMVPSSRRGRLEVWQVNAAKIFNRFLDRHREGMLNLIDQASLFSREDIAPLLDSTLPGMAEVSGLLAIREAVESRKYTHIVVDTAPFGHTLRLFALPGTFLRLLRFLELAASRDQVLAEHFGGRARSLAPPLLDEMRAIVQQLENAIGQDADLILVTSAEKFSLNESVRSAAELSRYCPPLAIKSIVLNRAVVRNGRCALCRAAAERTKRAQLFLQRRFPRQKLLIGEDPGFPLLGAAHLASFAKHVFAGKALSLSSPAPSSRSLRLTRKHWPTLNVPLSFVVGKGGVGKTTVAAALGLRTRRLRGAAVELCSVDPAPSLDDIFQQNIGDRPQPVLGDAQFRASEMDSIALFQAWVEEVRSSVEEATTTNVSGVHVDLSFERRLLSALLEMVPPGVDEVLAIFRVLDLLEGRDRRVVIDVAPSGHALELFRMPQRILAWTRPLLKTLARHRTLPMAGDAGMKIAELEVRVRQLLELLQDPKRAQIHAVMLAEPLPDRETERLLASLRKLKLSLQCLFVNRVLLGEDCRKCLRCRKAQAWQKAILGQTERRYPDLKIYLVRNFPREIAGKQALSAFTGELWGIKPSTKRSR